MNRDEWGVNMNAAVVCVLPGSRNHSLFFWLCCDMLNATLCASGGFRAQQVSSILVKSLSMDEQLTELAFYFWLWPRGHMRGAARGCIASVSPRDLICWPVDKANTWDTGEGELGQYVPTLWAPTILVSVNPLIMAFITSKNTRESVTRQEHAFQYLLSDRVNMCVKHRPWNGFTVDWQPLKKESWKLSYQLVFWSAGLPLDTQGTILRKQQGGGMHQNCSSHPLSQLCVYTALTVWPKELVRLWCCPQWPVSKERGLSGLSGQLLTRRPQCQHKTPEDRECHTSHIVERSDASHYAT